MTFGRFAESMIIMAILIFLLIKAIFWLKNAWAEAGSEEQSKRPETNQEPSAITVADADNDDYVNPLLSLRPEHAHISLLLNDENELDR